MLRRVLAALLIALIALTLATFGIAWYASGQLMAITHVHDTYPSRVRAADPVSGTVVLSRGPDAAEPGSFRLAWPGGHAIVGAVIASTPTTVTRRLFAVNGRLAPGLAAGIEPDLYTGDPWSALRLRYASVRVPTGLGPMPAWFVPGRRRTWVILVHGLGGSRADVLAPMAALHALGYPMLAITYRNDINAPLSPDHATHFGQTEWHDLAAAVGYARTHGAGGVVLYGYSMGGTMALIAARDPRLQPLIRALVLDSPVLDWAATLADGAARRGIPGAFADLTEAVLASRDGLDLGLLDALAHERALHTLILLFQGTADSVVPPALAARFAAARPGLITYVPVAGADHVSAIDTDPGGYRRAVDRFLAADP